MMLYTYGIFMHTVHSYIYEGTRCRRQEYVCFFPTSLRFVWCNIRKLTCHNLIFILVKRCAGYRKVAWQLSHKICHPTVLNLMHQCVIVLTLLWMQCRYFCAKAANFPLLRYATSNFWPIFCSMIILPFKHFFHMI